jgi:hypothetical protein
VRVEQVANLVVQNLKTMIDGEDRSLLRSKRKAITTLLPYAIWQERDGKPEMLDTFLRAIRTSKEWEFVWCRIAEKYDPRSLRHASHRALILVLPYIHWDWPEHGWYFLVRQWVAATSAVPYTEEVAQSVVDTLLQIASQEDLSIWIPRHVWLWLTKRPPLPPICSGRNAGTCAHVVKTVRALRNIEVLKSYFLLVWSEWNHFLPDSPDSSHPPPIDGASSRSTIMPFVPPMLPPMLPPFSGVPLPSMGIPIVPVTYPFSSTPTPVYVTMPNRHPPYGAHSVFSRHTFSSFDSIPGSPSSHILDNTLSHRSSSSSNGTLSRHTHNSPSGVSVRPPPPNTTPSHHPVHIADSVSSHRGSVGSDGVPSRPPSPIPVGTPIRYSPPIGVPIFHPPVPHPPIPHSQIFYPQIPPSTLSSSPSPNPHPPHIPISMPIIHSFHIPNNMPSSYSSGGFYEMQISIREDFGGVGMGHHRADLLQRLDQVIEQLDRGLEYLKQHNPEFNEDSLQRTKHQYQYLREMLLEMNMKGDQSCVLFNNRTLLYAHSCPGCTQKPSTYAYAHTLSRVHSPTARILGTPTSHLARTPTSYFVCTPTSYFVCTPTPCSVCTPTSCAVCTPIPYFVRTSVLISARLLYDPP